MNIKVKITRQENATYFNVPINTIVEVDFERYVAAVVASEIGNSHIEACKAQAVAARTFAMGRGVGEGKAISDSSSTAQAFRAARYDHKKYPNCIAAAEATMGQILQYNDKPISAVYSDCNGGRTYSSEEVWGSKRPYLIAQTDTWDGATGKKKNGHGIGMSQTGATYAAKNGIKYIDILSFYYPNTTLYDKYGEKVCIFVTLDELQDLFRRIQKAKETLTKIREEL